MWNLHNFFDTWKQSFFHVFSMGMTVPLRDYMQHKYILSAQKHATKYKFE